LSQHMLSTGHTDESVAFGCGYLTYIQPFAEPVIST
jgi:hypothetical protein